MNTTAVAVVGTVSSRKLSNGACCLHWPRYFLRYLWDITEFNLDKVSIHSQCSGTKQLFLASLLLPHHKPHLQKNIGGINIVLLHEWNITLLLSLSKVIYLLAFSIGSFFLFPREKKLYVVRTTIKVVYKWWNIAMRRQSHLFCRLALSPSESEVIQNLALRSNGRLGLSKLLPTSHFYFQNAATCSLASSTRKTSQ